MEDTNIEIEEQEFNEPSISQLNINVYTRKLKDRLKKVIVIDAKAGLLAN